jgi:HK97 family phage portal protein
MAWYDFLERLIQPKKSNTAKVIMTQLMQEIYVKEMALYTAVSYVANAISKCEIKTYENGVEVKEDSYFILNISPNENYNASKFWHKVVEKMYYDGEALVVSKEGKLFCADSFYVDKDPIKGNMYKNITIDGKEMDEIFTAKEVYLFGLDNKKVKDLINGISRGYSELIGFAQKVYMKSNSSKYKVKMPMMKAGDDEFNEAFEKSIEEQLKIFINSNEAVYTEYEGYELTDMTSNGKNKDVKDIVDLRKEIFEITAQACNIPLSLMSGNITNINDVVKAFITFAIDPIAVMMSDELTRKQVNGRELSCNAWKQGRYFKVDTSKINHIDILESANNIDKLIASGFACIDDLRNLTGMNLINNGFSKTHFITKNYDTIENRLKGEDITNG